MPTPQPASRILATGKPTYCTQPAIRRARACISAREVTAVDLAPPSRVLANVVRTPATEVRLSTSIGALRLEPDTWLQLVTLPSKICSTCEVVRFEIGLEGFVTTQTKYLASG